MKWICSIFPLSPSCTRVSLNFAHKLLYTNPPPQHAHKLAMLYQVVLGFISILPSSFPTLTHPHSNNCWWFIPPSSTSCTMGSTDTYKLSIEVHQPRCCAHTSSTLTHPHSHTWWFFIPSSSTSCARGITGSTDTYKLPTEVRRPRLSAHTSLVLPCPSRRPRASRQGGDYSWQSGRVLKTDWTKWN